MAPLAAPPFDEPHVGYVPGTTYGIQIDPHLAVTHNTAILGILGIGKTYLAWELMHRMLVEGIKVVALDITGRYGGHLRTFAHLRRKTRSNRPLTIVLLRTTRIAKFALMRRATSRTFMKP
jgi:Helicase HerA, central domain